MRHINRASTHPIQPLSAQQRALHPPVRADAARKARWLFFQQFRRPALYGATVVGVIVLIYTWQSGIIERQFSAILQSVQDMTGTAGFTVTEIRVRGRVETTAPDILMAIGVREGEPLIALDINDMKERVEALPWVASAGVQRRFPSDLVIDILEHQPQALWQSDGQLRLIAEDGSVIEDREPMRFANLPLVVGKGAPVVTNSLLHILKAEPELFQRVTAAVLVGERRWDVQIDGRITIRLPEEGLEAEWSHLAELQRQSRLLERNVTTIDLRIPGRLFVGIDANIEDHRAPAVPPTKPDQTGQMDRNPKGEVRSL